MAERKSSKVDDILARTRPRYDAFEPFRRTYDVSKILGEDSVTKILGEGAAATRLNLSDAVEGESALGRLTLSDESVKGLADSVLGTIDAKSIVDLEASRSLASAMEIANSSGAARLVLDSASRPTLDEFRSSTLIASEVIDSTRLSTIMGESVGALAGTINVEDLLGRASFEPGAMLGQIGKVDGSALVLGDTRLRTAYESLSPTWGEGGLLSLGDLIGPASKGIGHDKSLVAFPPDLVEDAPLESEFEVDAVVAEHQVGAQVYLALESPTTAERMKGARKRLEEGDAEALAQSLTSCRRALHSLADSVFPARSQPFTDRKGNERVVNDSAFKNRLIAFVEGVLDGTMLEVAEVRIESTAKSLDILIQQLSKGVHADIAREEAKQAYVETWATIARIARLTNRD